MADYLNVTEARTSDLARCEGDLTSTKLMGAMASVVKALSTYGITDNVTACVATVNDVVLILPEETEDVSAECLIETLHLLQLLKERHSLRVHTSSMREVIKNRPDVDTFLAYSGCDIHSLDESKEEDAATLRSVRSLFAPSFKSGTVPDGLKVWTVSRPEEAMRHQPFMALESHRLLWRGTSVPELGCVLADGVLPTYFHTDAHAGFGMTFKPKPSLGGDITRNRLFLGAHVTLGRSKEIAASSKDEADVRTSVEYEAPYHSIKMTAASNDSVDYAVFDVGQVEVKYIVEVPFDAE